MMKKNRVYTAKLAALALGVAALFPAESHAQDAGFEEIKVAFQSLKDGKYAEAYPVFKTFTDTWGGPRGEKLLGGGLGELYYARGRSALLLGAEVARDPSKESQEKAKALFDDCKQALTKCSQVKGDNLRPNLYRVKAFYLLGKTSQFLEEYEQAITFYRRFLKNRDLRVSQGKDSYDVGLMHIDLAICHFLQKQPDIEVGMEQFIIALENKKKFKVKDKSIVSAFHALSTVVVKQKEEKLMVDFLNENRAVLTLRPFEMYNFTPIFLSLASKALEADMQQATISLLSLLPSSPIVAEDFNSLLGKINELPAAVDGFNILKKETISKDSQRLSANVETAKVHELTEFEISAYLYEKSGNTRGAFGIFEQLELYHNDSPKREDNLFNLVRTSNNIGAVWKTEKYGRRFLKDFPDSDYKSQVEELTIFSLFQNGEYEKCAIIAQNILDSNTVTEGTPQHDLVLHCLSGSMYFLGKPVKAKPLLEKHIELYGKGTKAESKYVVLSEYMNASVDTYLQDYIAAAPKLDKFLENFPTIEVNAYLPNAKFDRANCHFQLDEYPPALDHLNVVINKFPDSVVLDRAYSLKGNVLQQTAVYDEAETAYKQGLEISRRRKNDEIEAEILKFLVGLLAAERRGKEANPQIKEAIPFYDAFWSKYQDSFHKMEVAAFGIPSLRASGRGKEGLTNLQGVITEMAQLENAPSLEKAINTYSVEYLKEEGNTPQSLEEHYRNFPGVGLNQIRARALLSMGLIGIFTDLKNEANALAKNGENKKANEEQAKTYQAMVDGQYEFLKQVPLDKLSNFILIRVGNSVLTTEGADPLAAVRFYDQVLANAKNNNKKGESEAMFGKAKALSTSGDSTSQAQALAVFEQIYNNKSRDNPANRQKALFEIVKIKHTTGDFNGCITAAQEYLEKYKKDRVLVRYFLGFAYKSTGKTEDAMSQLGVVLIQLKGKVKYSGPACHAVMQMTWDRNKPASENKNDKSDRQIAYELGYGYVKGLAAAMDKPAVPRSDREKYNKVKALFEQYEASPDIVKKGAAN